jgi:O-succinylbenzoate synthase
MEAAREFKFISRKFVEPHTSSTFTWVQRDSVVLREKIESGQFAYGEIAPVPEFPDQPKIIDIIEDAKKWANNQKLDQVNSLLPALSCIDCGIWHEFGERKFDKVRSSILHTSSNNDHFSPTMKRKIGILPIVDEINKCKKWLNGLPQSCIVRLDANGSLSIDELKRWIEEMAEEQRIQYIEQPLKEALCDELFVLAEDSPVPLAIDESIIAMGGPNAAANSGWKGFYILKPTLLNNWSMTIEFARENPLKTVFSTVFESPFGYEALLRVCCHSQLEAGITREPYRNLTSELPCHHQTELFAPAATQSELAELWGKL